MNASAIRLCNALWTAGNNAGNGYAPYTDVPGPDTVEAAVAAAVADGWTVEHAPRETDRASILSKVDEAEWLAIGGDAEGNGAWAVLVCSPKLIASWAQNSREVGEDDMLAICERAIAGDHDAQIAVMRAESEV